VCANCLPAFEPEVPDHVKAQAVEVVRPAAELMEKAMTPRSVPAQPHVPHDRVRGRSLGMERKLPSSDNARAGGGSPPCRPRSVVVVRRAVPLRAQVMRANRGGQVFNGLVVGSKIRLRYQHLQK
jgi:hypothetical protein